MMSLHSRSLQTASPCQRSFVISKPFPLRHTTRRITSWRVDTATTQQSERLVADPKATDSGKPDSTDAPSTASAGASSGTFPWTEHWYPVAIVDDLDPNQPHATHLLGIPLALWRDKQGSWHAVEDKCPHRLAPLSEGRIESDGTLQCAYHGWQFDGRGACTHIPQLRDDDKAQQVACANRRACVRAFPAQVVHGLLWVLPDSSERAHDEFARSPSLPKTAIKELLGGPEAEGKVQTTQWFVRDVPMRFDTLCENVMDPSHVPFTHHKVQGNRKNEKGTATRVHQEEFGMEGFKFDLDYKNPNFGVSTPAFYAPNYIRYGSPIRSLNVYAVPTRPGWSRIYATFLKDTNSPRRLPFLVEAIYSAIERTTWLEHIWQRNVVLDGDNYILHVQERLLHEDHKGDWTGSFYMPAPADSSVIGIRKWLDTYGGAVPTCEPGTRMPPRLTKREALDRYSQHTAHCRHCKKALRNVDLATGLAAAAGFAAAVWLAARALMGAPLLAPATGLGVLALAAAGAVVAGLRALRQQFFYVDYVHAHKH